MMIFPAKANWKKTPPPPRSREREQLDLWNPLGYGPTGERGGRVWHRMKLMPHLETTTQLRGLYPFLATNGLGAPGAYIGRDRYTRGAFSFDPFMLYEMKILTNPNLLLLGVIGSGKSALLKTMLFRLLAYGIKFMVPADTKGEYAAMGDEVDATVWRLGDQAISPFFAPPKPPRMAEEEYLRRVHQHRELLLHALGETASGRRLTAVEELMLDLALDEVTGANRGTSVTRLAQPTFPDLVEVMLNPTQAMADSVPIPLEELRRESRDLGLRFRSMVRGALRGVFDGPATPPDLSKSGFILDISRIRASEAAVALTMTCGQALCDMALTFSQDRWLKVLDECWRQIRYPAIVRRISEGQKLARGDESTAGSATLIALHRITDLLGAEPEVRELALGLLADTSTRVVYRQASDQLEETQRALSLTDVQTQLLTRLDRGSGLWQINSAENTFMVDHQILEGGLEWPLIDTDSRMSSVEGGEYEQLVNPGGQMAAEIGATPEDRVA